jgi:hypothetical protein
VYLRYVLCPCVSPLGSVIDDDAVLHVSAPVSVTSTLATRMWRVPGKESLVVFRYAGLAPED